MSEPCDILNDKREIRSLFGPVAPDDGDVAQVGLCGVTKIVAYGDLGQNAYMPFFAVYRGDEIWLRIPGSSVAVEYAPTPKPQEEKNDG